MSMAIDIMRDNIPSFQPSSRFSFSIDAETNDDYAYRSDSSSDFDFCISSPSYSAASSADELFSDGLIRPLKLQERFVISKSFSIGRPSQFSLPPLPPPKVIETSSKIEADQKNQTKSFWSIKRSCSLHCDYRSSDKKSSFWSLPLLSRSNSTGSIPKQTGSSKQSKKSTSSISSSSAYASICKPHSKIRYGGSNTNSVRIRPILNVPPSCNFKGTINLFGLGSLFRNGKSKKNKL